MFCLGAGVTSADFCVHWLCCFGVEVECWVSPLTFSSSTTAIEDVMSSVPFPTSATEVVFYVTAIDRYTKQNRNSNSSDITSDLSIEFCVFETLAVETFCFQQLK